jgi:hypothetical protein
MRDFPVEKLKPLPGRLSAGPVGLSIEIPLVPFTLDGELVQTSIYLGGVSLPSPDVLKLAGQTFSFPVNPTPGHIDGSAYVQHAHHPVDVTSIRFGRADGDAVETALDLLFVFEFEGLDDYQNTSWTLMTRLSNSQK